MTAKQQMKAMLDELMGTQRNGESNTEIKFDDRSVCKNFLLNCCPHDILSGTRMDVGGCPKIHNYALRADYEMASKDKDYFYDLEALENLQYFISDCDHKTEIAKRKLAETQEELDEDNQEKANQINILSEKIGIKLAEAETLGTKGEVEASMALLKDVEDLKRQKLDAELILKNSLPLSSYQQHKLRVCEVCSSYLGVHDNEKRLADHFGGKLHLGFIYLRDKMKQFQSVSEERKVLRDLQMQIDRNNRYPVSRRSNSRPKFLRSRSRSISRKRSRSKSSSRRRKRSSRTRDKSPSADRSSRKHKHHHKHSHKHKHHHK